MEKKVYFLRELGKRTNLEDEISEPRNNANTFIVCDGVGGNNYGEIASKLAVKHFYEILNDQSPILNIESFNLILKNGLENFKNELKIFIENTPNANNASTTLALVHFVNNLAFIAWSGDSRVYFFRNNSIQYVTKDHSLVQSLIDQGELSIEAAENHPHKNIITKSLNIKAEFDEIESYQVEDIQVNDRFFLCSDGVIESYNNEEITDLIHSSSDITKEIGLKCLENSKDNYSMILVELVEPFKKKGSIKNNYLLIGFTLVLAAIWIFYFLNNRNNTSNNSLKSATQSGFVKNIDSLKTK